MMSLSGPRGCFVMGWNVFVTSGFSLWGWGIWVGGWVCGYSGEKGVMIGGCVVEGISEEGVRGEWEESYVVISDGEEWDTNWEGWKWVRCRRRVNRALGNCCLLLEIHMGLVKWFFLDCFRMWGNDSESVADVVFSWRNTTLMWLITVLKTALLWRGLVRWYNRRMRMRLDGFSVNRVLGGEGHWNRVDILLWGTPVLRGWNRRGDFTLLLLRIMNHRDRKMKG